MNFYLNEFQRKLVSVVETYLLEYYYTTQAFFFTQFACRLYHFNFLNENTLTKLDWLVTNDNISSFRLM